MAILSASSTGCLTDLEGQDDRVAADLASRGASLRDTQYRTVDLDEDASPLATEGALTRVTGRFDAR